MEIEPGTLRGAARVPGSKSHTIRALVIASLAPGTSTVTAPLDSGDTQACLHACRMLGAEMTENRDGETLKSITVTGVGGAPQTPSDVIDVGNSGTTLYILTTTAALAEGWSVFTGDEQIRNRPVEPLLASLRDFGVAAFTTRGNGAPPFVVHGPLGGPRQAGAAAGSQAAGAAGSQAATVSQGAAAGTSSQGAAASQGGAAATSSQAAARAAAGQAASTGRDAGTLRTSIECRTSQYLSSLLLGLPLGNGTFEIDVPLLYERPYVEMTFWWLDGQGIRYEREGYERFRVPGGQAYAPFSMGIPGDFSSATFLFCAAAITGSGIVLEGLDMSDPQGDKAVLDILGQMGCRVEDRDEGLFIEGPDELVGGTFDLNAMPDAVPALAVTACCARTETQIINVPQARQKETDRLAVMAQELSKMGASVEEREDGLVISPPSGAGRPLRGADVDSHLDHRIAMALSVAGLVAEGRTTVAGAESAAVTFPGFYTTLESLRA